MLTNPVMPASRPFALIDRDGTLITERNYLREPDDVELIPGAATALRRLQDVGCGICLVTNQSGIARGFFDVERLRRIHNRLEELLHSFDVQLDGIFVCPHAPGDGCRCRKPMPGLIEQAVSVHGFDPRESWVIGDKETDVGLGHAVGARSILVRTGYGRQYDQGTHADFVADDLPRAADFILCSMAESMHPPT
jgi:D-glycero-D-manno-heptose 1,7-bisphosphate phosphatase